MEIGNIIHHFGKFLLNLNCKIADFWSQSDISVQIQRMTSAFAQRPLYAPAEVLLRCRRPYCAAMATTRRPHCALLERPCHGICFEDAQSARRRSAFYAIPQRPLAMLAIVLCASRRSVFSWTLWDRRYKARIFY